jgi:hypothetical protein
MNRLAAILIAACALAAGCGDGRSPDAIGAWSAPAESFARVQRVVFIDLEAPDAAVQRDAGDALREAIADRRLFRLEPVARDDARCVGLNLSCRQKLSFADMAAIRKAFDCDAVLLGAVTRFEPHPRMKTALDLRLVDLRSGKPLWALEHTWDAAEERVQDRAEDFFEHKMGDNLRPADWRLILMSPRYFLKFVASEAAGTMPQRQGAAPPLPAGRR